MGAETFAAIPSEMRADLFVQRTIYTKLRWRTHRRIRAALDALEFSEVERAFVTGVLEEHRGDVRGTLAQYDRFPGDGRLANRADELRFSEHMYWHLLQSLEVPGRANPSSAEPFLTAAVGLSSRHSARLALAMAERLNNSRDDGMVAVANAFLANDCAAMMEAVDAHPRALENREATLIAAECAFAAGHREKAEEYLQQRYRAERVRASRQARDGEEANGHGVYGLAMRHYRRALWHNPGHAVAAAALARLLNMGGRTEEAEAVLRDCYHASRGLPNASSALEDAASEIGITL